MTAHATGISLAGRVLGPDSLPMIELETQRVVVLSGPGGVSRGLVHMAAALELELVTVQSHHDLPFRLHHARPIAVISELDPTGQPSCAALRCIATYHQDLPVLLVSGDDPAAHGTIDAVEQLWGLSGLHRLMAPPGPGDLIRFLCLAGRQDGRGRLMPMA